ncbi:glycosyltransferase family 2 protein [Aerococcus urinaeequi]|uniref:Glycosyltransferase 2-like domain-containing protein n=1 Tax=Aerococcus urinaeequi TaxID=51665 RepID=A0AAC8WZR1_9LACT|nr:glycosyltransferase family 2 protein [Aerococcus urinaeequi]AMB97020.1 hypothetical protein AWM74_01680 [Aerococcus urinaeequi]
MKNNLLSVVIPTKNRPDFLKNALLCFEPFCEDLDIVVVDDGSCDKNRELNRNLTTNIAIYFYNMTSTGGGGARNLGSELTDSQYIWFFDDDDIVEEATVRDVLNILSSGDGSDIYLLPMAVFKKNELIKTVIPTLEKNNFNVYRNSIHQVNTSCTIMKRSKFVQVGKWDSNFAAGQDTDLFLRLSLVSSYSCISTKPVSIQTDHHDRITKNINKRRKGTYQFLKKNWKLMSVYNIFKYIKSYIYYTYLIIKEM